MSPKAKKFATRETILEVFKANPLKTKEITVPEWGNLTINLRELTVRQQQEMYEKSQKEDGLGLDDTVKMLQYACVDADGNPLFDETHLEILMDQSGKVVTDLVKQISEMNRIDSEEQEKNSEIQVEKDLSTS